MTQKFSEVWLNDLIFARVCGGSAPVSRIQPLFWKQRLKKAWLKDMTVAINDIKECSAGLKETKLEFQRIKDKE